MHWPVSRMLMCLRLCVFYDSKYESFESCDEEDLVVEEDE